MAVGRVVSYARRGAVFLVVLVVLSFALGSGAAQAASITDTEPNNHWTEALGPVVSGEKVSGAISATGDVDWYYFYVSAPSDVTLGANVSGPYLDLYRYDAGYLDYIDDLYNGTLKMQLSAGLYYIKYRGSTGQYNFTLTGAGVTSARPAGVPLHGQVISLAETLETHWTEATLSPQSAYTYRAEIGTTGDIDWYYFYVSAPSDVTLGANVSGPYLDLYRYDAGYLDYIDDLYNGTLKMQLSAGLYYIKYRGSTGQYNFTLTGAGVTSARPAGVPLHGQVISLPETLETDYSQAYGPLRSALTYRAGIDTTGDVDYYYFDVSTQSDVTLGANVNGPYLNLYRYGAGTLTYLDDHYNGTLKKQLAAGRYYIKYQGSTGSYSFTVTGAGLASIDTTPPVSIASGYDAAWHSTPVTISFSASDPAPNASGVAYTEYRLDGGSWARGTQVIVPAPPATKITHIISYRSADLAGNVESEKTCQVKIDTTGTSPGTDFTDIGSSPYAPAIRSLAAAGIIGGYADGTFRPNNPVLRAQFAKMIVLSLGLTVTEGGTPLSFTDVERPTNSLYPDDYVAVASANGLVNGIGSGKFASYVDISRAQLLTIVVRAAQRFKPAAIQEPPSNWRGVLPANDATHGRNIARAEYSALLTGFDLASFSIWGTATRAQVAQVLWNLRER